MQILDEEPVLTVAQAAKVTGFCTASIRKAIADGRLQAFRLSAGKNATYRIPATELKKLFNGQTKN